MDHRAIHDSSQTAAVCWRGKNESSMVSFLRGWEQRPTNLESDRQVGTAA